MICRTCGGPLRLCPTCPGKVWICYRCGKKVEPMEENDIRVKRKGWGWFLGEDLRIPLERDFYIELEIGIGVLSDGSVDYFQDMGVPFIHPLKRTYLAQYAHWMKERA